MYAYASHPLTHISHMHAYTYTCMHKHTHKLTHTCIQRGKSSIHRFDQSRSCKEVTYLKPLAKQGSELTQLSAMDCWDRGCKPATARSPPPTHPPLPCTFLGTRSHAAGQNGLLWVQQGHKTPVAGASLPTHLCLPPTFLGTRSHAAGQNGLPWVQQGRKTLQ